MKPIYINEVRAHLSSVSKYTVWPYILVPFGFYFFTDLPAKNSLLFWISSISTITLGLIQFRISNCFSCLSENLQNNWARVLFAVSLGLHFSSSVLITVAIDANGYLSWSGLLACAAWVGIMEVISSSFYPYRKLGVTLALVFGLMPSLYFLPNEDISKRNFATLGILYVGAILFKIIKLHSYFYKSAKLKFDLTQERDFLQKFIDLLPARVSWLQQDLTYKSVNKSLADLYGIPKEDFIGKKFGFLGSSGQASNFFDDFIKAKDVEFQGEVNLKAGDTKRHLVFAKKFKANAEEEIVFVALDIEEYKRTQEELELERAKTLHASRLAAVGEMAANIGHEIKNPLSVVNVGCYLIEEDLKKNKFDPEKTKERLHKMSSMVHQIVKIVNGIQNLSKDHKGEDFTWLDIKSIISDPVSICSNKFIENNVDFKIEIEEKVEILCQPYQIAQIVLNLLNNSFEALLMQENRKIIISSQVLNTEEFCLYIKDNGPGVTNPDRLFTPFYTTKSKTGGSGIGLNISRKIIETHGGQLTYSRQNNETVFTIKFPKEKIQVVKKVAA